MADADAIARAFTTHYYNCFDAEATRPTLATLYQPGSMLTFEGAKLQARRKVQEDSLRLGTQNLCLFLSGNTGRRRYRAEACELAVQVLPAQGEKEVSRFTSVSHGRRRLSLVTRSRRPRVVSLCL